MKQIKLKIYGQVQGVFFRAETQKIAESLSLSGVTKNLDDGTVEVVAEGEEENLKKLIQWAEQGPKLAKVEKMDIIWNQPSGQYSEFRVE